MLLVEVVGQLDGEQLVGIFHRQGQPVSSFGEEVVDVGRLVKVREQFSTEQNAQELLHLDEAVEVLGREALAEVAVDLFAAFLFRLVVEGIRVCLKDRFCRNLVPNKHSSSRT